MSISMSVSEAKKKLESMRIEHDKFSTSEEPSEREYASYLSVQIAAYEKAISDFEA